MTTLVKNLRVAKRKLRGHYVDKYEANEIGTILEVNDNNVKVIWDDKTESQLEVGKDELYVLIYQVHEYGGEWEDSYDYIIDSFFSEEKAMEYMTEKEKEEEELVKCHNCPIPYCPNSCDIDCNDKKACKKFREETVKEYCNNYKPDKDGDCKNFYLKDSSFFKAEIEAIKL